MIAKYVFQSLKCRLQHLSQQMIDQITKNKKEDETMLTLN